MGVFMVDFKKSAKQRLVDSINESNDKDPFTLAITDVLFGTPVIVNQHNCNTKITATATNRFTKTRTLFYNRHNLSRYFSEVTNANIPAELPTNSIDLLPILLETKNINLLSEDIILEPIVGTDSYELKASPTSLGWIGSAVLTFIGVPLTYGFALDSGALLQTDSGASFILDDDIIVE